MQTRFTTSKQFHFADFSGDYNPMHTDTVLARRLMFGDTVVHGIHLILWALDQWGQDNENVELDFINITFHKPVYTEEQIFLHIKKNEDKHVVLEISNETSLTTSIEFKWHGNLSEDICFSEQQKQECKNLSIDKIENCSGYLPIYFNSKKLKMLFPNLSTFSKLQIGQLTTITRLIGMECPGLRSIFSSMKLVFEKSTNNCCLNYKVSKVDKRFGLALIDISSRNMQGTIKTFVRPEPQQQISYNEAKTMVDKDEFLDQTALIIGGSRGLGEVTAKLLAAGGAQIIVTYNQGMTDANNIVSEINSNNGHATSLKFDVLSDTITDLTGPICLYYFATPFIMTGDRGNFSDPLYQKFYKYYVHGFSKIFSQMKNILDGVFYPSSIFVEEPPDNMMEYVMAKTTGETLCNFLQKTSGIKIYRPRLPKMSTDQTTNFFNIDKQDAAPIILRHIRMFNKCLGQK